MRELLNHWMEPIRVRSRFPELYRNPDDREHLTPHIERAKKIPKQVKLGSEHFTKENKNQEMWSLITRGNFDTVTFAKANFMFNWSAYVDHVRVELFSIESR